MSNIVISPESGILEFNYNPPSGAAIGDTNASIRLDATGGQSWLTGTNVGIGTSNPLQELHLSSASPVIRLQDSDGTNQFTELEQAGQSLYLNLRNNSQNGNLLVVGKNGSSDTEFMRIVSDGKVRIGTYTEASQ